MTRQPFHHGNLRAELLERAERMLRDRGAEDLSLRELARDAGVSHGAPRSHFRDRGALLDALAERGFDRLTEVIKASGRGLPLDRATGPDLLRAAGRAYLKFAAENPALLSLMSGAKAREPAGAVHEAGARFLATLTTLVGATVGPRIHDPATIVRLTLLLSATVQGVSSMVVSGRITPAQGEALLDDGIAVFVAGTAGFVA